MGRIVGITLVLYVAALTGLPLGNLALAVGIVLLLFACLSMMVSAKHTAERLFGYLVPLLLFGLAWPVITAFAHSTAPVVLACLAIGTVLYLVGVSAWKRLTEHGNKKAALPLPPRPRLRADPPPRAEPVVLPVPDDRPFDLFASRPRGRS